MPIIRVLDSEASSKRTKPKNLLVSALLSHQMDQLLKLNKELTEGKQEVDGIKGDIKSMEQELKKQEIMMKGHTPKLVVSNKCSTYKMFNLKELT